jgi:hypothetical protein
MRAHKRTNDGNEVLHQWRIGGIKYIFPLLATRLGVNNAIAMDNTIDEPYIAGGGPGPATLSSSTTQDLTKIVSFMREDQDHIVFKRFERLNLYNLLCLQHRLTMVDKQIALHEDNDVHALARVLSTLEPLMKSYSKLSHRCSDFLS